MSLKISAADLESKITALFVKAGSQPAEAKQVASNLVMANLSGHDSHGVGMTPRYVDAILEGNLTPNSNVAIKVDTGPTRCMHHVIGEFTPPWTYWSFC